MTERIEAARSIRIGAERLRQLASAEANQELASQMVEIAAEMDHHAAELERSFVTNPPRPANEDDAVA